MREFAFTVEGSQGDEYQVSFSIDGQHAESACTCRAGQMGMWCRHRSAILDGDVTDLRSDNVGDVLALRDVMRGTDLALRYEERTAAEARAASASSQSRQTFAVQDRVEVAKDIAGTGIKAGHVGEVGFVQLRGREIGYSTDLAATAYLVRFSGGAEVWTTADELLPARGKAPTKAAPMQVYREQRVISRTRFRDGFAVDWVFGVSEAFKAALDIMPTPRVLARRSPLLAELEDIGVRVPAEALAGDSHALAHLATTLTDAGVVVTDISVRREAKGEGRVIVTLETEGRSPTYAFAAGDIMHDPPDSHRLPWSQARWVLRRSVQVDAASSAKPSVEDDDGSSPGEVRATLRRYADGQLVGVSPVICTQSEFVRLLRDGVEPRGRMPAA